MKTTLLYVCLFAVVLMLFGCAGPEEKKMKFFENGQTLMEQQNYKKAGLEFKNAIQIDPKFTEAYYLLASCELKDSDLKPAFSHFRKVVEQDEHHHAAQYQLAKLFLAAQQPEKAKEKIDLILATDPAHKEALIMRGALLERMGEHDMALIHLRGLLEQGIDAADIYLLLALTHKTMKNHQREGQVLEDGLSRHPDNLHLLTALSDFYRLRNELDKAIDLAEKILQIQPETARNYIYLAALQSLAGQQTTAEQNLKKLLALDRDSSAHRLAVARFYLSRKQLDKAEQTLNDGLSTQPGDYALNKALSELYLGTGQRDKAIEQLNSVISLAEKSDDPVLYLAKTELAKIYLAGKEIDRARALCDEILQEKNDISDAHFVRGKIYLLEGDGQKAIAEFRPVVTQSPTFLPGYLALADAYMQNNELNLAADTLRNANKIDPLQHNVLISLARVLMMQQKYKLAQEQLESLLAQNPADQQALLLFGDLHLERKEFKNAEELFSRIVENAPKSPLGYAKLAESAMRQSQWTEANSHLLRALEYSPDAVELQNSLVQNYIRSGQFVKAMNFCREAQKKAATDQMRAFYEQLNGDILVAQKKFDQAEKAYSKAIELYPEWPTPEESLVKILLLQKKTTAAEDRLQSTIRQSPDRVSAYLELGQIYYQKGERAKAVNLYDQVLQRHPELWSAANDLAFILSEGETSAADLERAANLARKAQQVRPDEPRVLDTLGWVFYRQGQIEQALMYVRQAHDKDPGKAVLNYHLGRILYDQGRLEQAKIYLQLALNADDRFLGRNDAQTTLESIQ